MPFKLPKSYYEKQKEIHDLKYIDFNGERIHISDLENRSITSEIKAEMRMNSYAQDDLPPKLTDQALVETARYYVSHCQTPRFPCVTYDESLIHKIVPELCKRIEELTYIIETMNQ